MSQATALEIACRVGAALDACGVEYFIGGSVASSIQGHQRLTNDIDVVARLPAHSVDRFKAALGSAFDVDEVALKEAMRLRKSWNIFFVPSAFRIDIFSVGSDPFDEEEMRRRIRVEVLPGRVAFVKSPEDTVLRKLLWFKAGGEASSQQLRDVVEVIRVQGDRLDVAYLEAWAKTLGIVELLERANAAAR